MAEVVENAVEASPPTDPPELDPERQKLARRYARQRHRLEGIDLAISAILVLVLLFGGLGFALRDALAPLSRWQPVSDWRPLQIAVYFLILAAATLVVGSPLRYYSGYILPHRYG